MPSFAPSPSVRGTEAIGVVLSGTGSDGALGLEAIKAAGGITFAQDTALAGFDGMPRAAVATGCVDFVLPPIEIAARLARIGGDLGPHRPDGPPPTLAADLLAPIFDLLRQRTGVDFAQYKIGTMQRRVLRRMALRHIHALADYIAVLRAEPAAVDALYADLLINVTRFFREPELFTVLSETVFPEMLKRREVGGSIRIWVPGCATGQEAYSFAIGLVESLGHAPTATPIQVFATDLSNAAIAVARTGLYPHKIEADVSPERLRRFFVKEARGYRVAKAIRELCVFAQQNIASDPPFSQLDLISCRNVLIYLQPLLHERIFALFHYALKPDGFLVLGNSESIGVRVRDVRSRRQEPAYLRTQCDARPGAVLRLSHIAPSEQTGDADDERNAAAANDARGDARGRPDRARQLRPNGGGHRRPAPRRAIPRSDGRLSRAGGRHAELRSAGDGPSGLAHRASHRGSAGPQAGGHCAYGGILIHDAATRRYVDIEVIPFKVTASDAQFFVVLFEDVNKSAAARSQPGNGRVGRRGNGNHNGRRPNAGASGELEQRLDAATRRLHEIEEEHGTAIAELQVANEEVQSTNEELQSTNEEMETAKEELQSANEELATLNDELGARNGDLGLLNDDLTNLLTSMHVPAVIAGSDLRIRRYTAGAERLMHVGPTDVGRRISDLTANVDVPELEKLIAEVVDTRVVQEREVRDAAGCWYSMLVRPYETAEHTCSGAVIVYQDINDRKHRAERVDAARRYADAIVETVREGLLVLDDTFRVQRANRAFYEMFQTNAAETESRSLFELGEGHWDIPPLRALREEAIPKGAPVQRV